MISITGQVSRAVGPVISTKAPACVRLYVLETLYNDASARHRTGRDGEGKMPRIGRSAPKRQRPHVNESAVRPMKALGHQKLPEAPSHERQMVANLQQIMMHQRPKNVWRAKTVITLGMVCYNLGLLELRCEESSQKTSRIQYSDIVGCSFFVNRVGGRVSRPINMRAPMALDRSAMRSAVQQEWRESDRGGSLVPKCWNRFEQLSRTLPIHFTDRTVYRLIIS